ncbi:hypothetical protein [Leptobacterium sp. I13]|uniref:hypothetical protein n=1 Tax=Leptobacterium meishanense TaxID=3128904 RepID=UPI0030ECA5C4
MTRKVFVGICIIFSLSYSSIYGQEGSASPYSFFGIGELRFKGVVENQMMGGVSVYPDSLYLNLKNPAAYGKLQLTAYAVGGSYNLLNIKNDEVKESSSLGTFDYLALGLPISKKIGIGFGVLPYTSVGYRLISVDESQELDVLDQFTGEGGLNRAFFSIGYAITEGLSIGATGNYDFGKIENSNLRIRENVELGTRETNASSLSGMDFNFAVNYQKDIGKGYTIYSSLLYAPETNIASENERTIATIAFIDGREIPVEEVEVDLDALGLEETDLVLPSSITFGLGLGKKNKWFVGGEYEFKKNSKFDNPFVTIDNLRYEDASRISVGGFYIPRYDSFTNYFSRIVYRLGVRYEQTGINLNNSSVDDFGISFGLGLPVGISKLNVGFEIGQRGDTSFGKIQENYFNIRIGLSLSDKWFIKNKYQ